VASTTRPFLGEYTTFAKAFPSVRDVRICGEQFGDMDSEMQRHISSSGLNPATTIRCSNRRCQQGGYQIEHLIRSMIDQRQSQFSTTIHCDGHEGTPKGRRKGGPCLNYAKLTITLTFEDGVEGK
jgi:hypothetical protein